MKKHGEIILMSALLVLTGAIIAYDYNAAIGQMEAVPSSGVGRDAVIPYKAAETEETAEPEESESSDEVMNQLISIGIFKLTAYCPCPACCGAWAHNRPVDAHGNEIVYTASGEIAEEGKTIAVDPAVIAYGTEVIINGRTYIAEDSGSAIKENRIDVYMENHSEAMDFGVQYTTVYVKENGYEQN